MIGDNSKRALFENHGRRTLQNKFLINLSGEPLRPYETPLTNPDLRYTCFRYTLIYNRQPKRNAGQLSKYKFTLMGDLFQKNNLKFNDVLDLKMDALSNKEADFILKYTTFSSELLKIAKENPMHGIQVTLRYVEYNNMLKKKVMAKTGKKPTYSMFIDPALAEIDSVPFKEWLKKYNEEF